MTDEMLEFLFAALISLLSWFFGGIDGPFKVLIAFSVVDYISGTCVAWNKGIISSSIGFRGIVKKCVLFTFVGIAHLIDMYLLGHTEVMRTAVCLFYIGNEGISIIENADRLGIPIPKMLKEKFLQLKEDTEHEGDTVKK